MLYVTETSIRGKNVVVVEHKNVYVATLYKTGLSLMTPICVHDRLKYFLFIKNKVV